MRILNTHYEDVPPEKSLTPEEIEQICCERMPVDECSEVGRVSDYNGASQDDIDQDAALEQALADNPGKRILGVRIEDIGRPGKPCGKIHETWQGRLNCCDFVEPMVWDSDISVEVLAPGSRGVVGVIGGAPPYHWSVRGEGMTLDGYNMRDGFTDTPYTWIYAGPFACGFAPITVTDGCSVVKKGIRSTAGEWQNQAEFRPSCLIEDDPGGCLFLCSAYGNTIPGPENVSDGEYWVGPSKYNAGTAPPTIAPMEFDRSSEACGLWAGDCGTTVYRPAPGSNGKILYPVLHSFGIGDCYPQSGPPITARLYWFAPNSTTFKWVC